MRILERSPQYRMIESTVVMTFGLIIALVTVLLPSSTAGQSIASPIKFDRLSELDKASASPTAIVTVTAPIQFVLPGTSFNVPITTTDLSFATTGVDVISYDITLTYDPAVIIPQVPAASGIGTISENGAFTINTLTPGTIIVSFFRIEPLVGAGTLFNFRFTAVGPTPSSSPLTWTNFRFNEGDPDDLAVNGLVAISLVTASETRLSGRVLSQNGVGLRNAIVSVTDTQGVVKRTVSSSLGYYSIDELPAGQTYVISVASKRFQFTPRVVTITDEITDFDLIAESGGS